MKTSFFLPVLSLLAVAAAAHAQVIISENWESYSNGQAPAAPWVIWSGSPSGSLGTISVTNTKSSSFSSGTNSALLSGTSTTGGGVALSQTFASTTSALSIAFDFYLPSSGVGVLPSFNLAGTSNSGSASTGMTLNFSNGFLAAGNYIANQGGSWNTGTVITPTQLGKWWHVEITTTDPTLSSDSYSVRLTPDGGQTVVASDLAFINDLRSFNRIEFSWNSANGAGSVYVDNIVVAAVPEPSVLLLVPCGIAVLTFSRRVRKTLGSPILKPV